MSSQASSLQIFQFHKYVAVSENNGDLAFFYFIDSEFKNSALVCRVDDARAFFDDSFRDAEGVCYALVK